jgi:corrinoid protein of di/trimethylamine methyltransferase
MTKEQTLKTLKEAVVNLDLESVAKASGEILSKGYSPIEAIKAMGEGLEVVGKKYEAKEYFLAELMMAGEAVKEAVKILQPAMKGTEIKTKGKVVIGTVRGDLHDIGKEIVVTLLSASGFDVKDLGADVASETFVEVARKEKPNIVAMSALLTTSMSEMESVVKALEKARLRKQVKVLIGGAPVDAQFAKRIGADSYAEDAIKGVQLCNKWVTK